MTETATEPRLRAVRAIRYVTAFREGGSLPGLVEADDDGLYVVKFRGAGQGPRALVAEWLAGEKAQQIYADSNYEYPVRAGVAVNPTIAGYGKLTADPLPISRIAANRKAASTLVDKVGFDN